MRRLLSAGFLLLVGGGLCLATPGCRSRQPAEPDQHVEPDPQPVSRDKGQKPSPKRVMDAAPRDLNLLNLEVKALQMLYDLDLTPPQLAELSELAREVAPGDRPRKQAKGSEKFRQALLELRAALLRGEDEKIDALIEKRDAIYESENPEVDDAVDVTPAARQRAARFLRRLDVGQVVAYTTRRGGDLPDPRGLLLEVLEKATGMEEEARKEARTWLSEKEVRDWLSEEVGWLVAGGTDAGRAGKVKERVAALLDRAHQLKDEEAIVRGPELKKEAEQIVGDLGPTEVLRYVCESDLAELFSNPRLPAALQARLKK